MTGVQTCALPIFGSSSTEGVGATSPAAAYPARLEAELAATLPPPSRVRVLNCGIGGEDAEDMARRIPAVVAEHPDLVVWQTGSNDTLKGNAVPRFVELTRQGIAAIRAAVSDVLLLEPQFCPALEAVPDASRYRAALRGLAAELKVPLLRRYDLMRAQSSRLDEMIAADGLHMTDAGYAWLAHEVACAILAGTGRAEGSIPV